MSKKENRLSASHTEPRPAGRKPAYVLITPARNEAKYIESTIRSVINQTTLPLKWVIVSDGSTDGTDSIAEKYAAGRPWIEVMKMPERRERHFAGKVGAFNAGFERVRDLPYEVIGNLDGDISFGPDHFEFLITRFAENTSLGVAGTAFVEDERVAYDYNFTDINHVSGQCQLFRKECFQSIGGYRPRKIGGIDLVAVVTARMQGWQTRTFPEKVFMHHRTMGTGTHSALMAHYKTGRLNYVLGSHPLWEAARAIYQMTKRPYLLRGLLCFAGYCRELLKRTDKDVPAEYVAFVRREQMKRLKKFLEQAILRRGRKAAPAGEKDVNQ